MKTDASLFSDQAKVNCPRSTSDASIPMLRLRDVSKRYDNGVVALSHLSLDVFEGEFVSLVGPSGCGKSSVLRILAGLGSTTSGFVERFGRRQSQHIATAEEIGFVFQDPTLLPWANVLNNVALPLRLKRRSQEEIVEESRRVLHIVGLSQFENAFPRELSGGMKMRVSIARALVTRPRLLLMDEPFAALDEFTRAKLDDDLIEIQQRTRCTIIFVTHNSEESIYLSTRVIVMAARPGRVVGEVQVASIYPRGREFRRGLVFAEAAEKVSSLLDEVTALDVLLR